MKVAQKLRGEYAGAGWRTLGALGTVFTLGFNKSTRALASGSKNERSVQLASFYTRQADENHVYAQLSVAGQVRTLPSLPVGTVLTVGGQQMAVEKFQEKKGRRVVRLVQLDDAREIFLLDVTNPDAPVLRRAVGRGREVTMRAYRDARSPLPAFASTEASPAAAPTPLETMTDGVLTAILNNDLPAAESTLVALDARLVANVLPGDDPSSLQEARAAILATLNYRLLTAARSPVRVFQDRDGLHLRVPSAPTPDPDAVARAEAERMRILDGHINGLLAALETADLSVRAAAAQAALVPLQGLATAAANDADAAAIAARANQLITQVYTDVGEPVPAVVEIAGRTLSISFMAAPAPVPVVPTEAERRADLIRRVNVLIVALDVRESAAQALAIQSALVHALQPAVTAAADDIQAAELVRQMNDLLVGVYAPAPAAATLVMGAGRVLSVEFPAALPLSEDDLREQFAGSLEAPLADVRALSEEHRRPENRNSHEWWIANRGRYVAFRTTIAAALRAEAARATDVSYQRELQDFARAIERVIDLDGNFPGGHPAIDLIISQATALQRDLRPASGVS